MPRGGRKRDLLFQRRGLSKHKAMARPVIPERAVKTVTVVHPRRRDFVSLLMIISYRYFYPEYCWVRINCGKQKKIPKTVQDNNQYRKT